MKTILFGESANQIKELVEKNGFITVEENPDYIISFGGDGTIMRSETAYPGVPKILLRNSAICKKCSTFSNEEVLRKVANRECYIEKVMKLEAIVKDEIFTAFNDVTVHNQNPRHGIRYAISINHKPLGREIIGDGIVVATPFGSTAYYRSITDSYIESGIGLAFNNSTEQADHVVLKDDAVIELTVIRGPAIVFADNDHREVVIHKGEMVLIRKSSSFAQIVCPVF